MKIKVTLYDADGFWDSALEAAREVHTPIWYLTDEEHNGLVHDEAVEIISQLKPWVGNGEIIDIEFDLDNQTATVVKRQQ